jgi:hypothetical protein
VKRDTLSVVSSLLVVPCLSRLIYEGLSQMNFCWVVVGLFVDFSDYE